MNFWLWACLYDGDAYLTASREVTAILRMPKSPQSMAEFNQRRIAAQQIARKEIRQRGEY